MQALTTDGQIIPLGIISDGLFITDEFINEGIIETEIDNDGIFDDELLTSNAFFLNTGSGLDWTQMYSLDSSEGVDMNLLTLDSFGEVIVPVMLPDEPIINDGIIDTDIDNGGEFSDE
mgnify:CR=1 FL=1